MSGDQTVIYEGAVVKSSRRRLFIAPLVITVVLFLLIPIVVVMNLRDVGSPGLGLGSVTVGVIALLALAVTLLTALLPRRPLRIVSARGRGTLTIGNTEVAIVLPARIAASYYIERGDRISRPVLSVAVYDAAGGVTLALEQHLQPRDPLPVGWPQGHGPVVAAAAYELRPSSRSDLASLVAVLHAQGLLAGPTPELSLLTT